LVYFAPITEIVHENGAKAWQVSKTCQAFVEFGLDTGLGRFSVAQQKNIPTNCL
jgi:hypothetical protein